MLLPPLVCVLISTHCFPPSVRHCCFGFQCLRILLCETSFRYLCFMQLPQSPNSNDLINLMLPNRARPSDLEVSFLFQALDLAFPNMNISSNRSSRHAVLFLNHLSVQNVHQHLSQPIPTSSLPSPV